MQQRPTLNPEVSERLLLLAMEVWREWWDVVGLPHVRMIPTVAMLRWTWGEN